MVAPPPLSFRVRVSAACGIALAALLGGCNPDGLTEATADDQAVADRAAVNDFIVERGETIRDLAYHHRSKFSDLDPAGYFVDEAVYLDLPNEDGSVVARSGLAVMEIDESLDLMVASGALSDSDAEATANYLVSMEHVLDPGTAIPDGKVSDGSDDDEGGNSGSGDGPTYETVEQRMTSLKQELLDDPDLSNAMREELYVMLSAIEGIVVDEVQRLASEYGESLGGAGEVSARGIKIDCLFGMKPSCWVDAVVKYAISSVAHAAAAIATGGASLGVTAATAVAGAVTELTNAQEKGVTTYLTAILTGYASSGKGGKCSCDKLIEEDPCAIVQPTFIVDPRSVDCDNAGSVRLSVSGAPDAPNRYVRWDFKNAHEENDPVWKRNHETTRDYITVVQIDPNEPVYIGALVEYSHAKSGGSKTCAESAATPNPDESTLRKFAWNLYELTGGLERPYITGGQNLPAGDNSTYRANGLFRQIPGVNVTSLAPNYAGRISSPYPDDPHKIGVTWPSRTSGGSVYVTVTNSCGEQKPAYLPVNVY